MVDDRSAAPTSYLTAPHSTDRSISVLRSSLSVNTKTHPSVHQKEEERQGGHACLEKSLKEENQRKTTITHHGLPHRKSVRGVSSRHGQVHLLHQEPLLRGHLARGRVRRVLVGPGLPRRQHGGLRRRRHPRHVLLRPAARLGGRGRVPRRRPGDDAVRRRPGRPAPPQSRGRAGDRLRGERNARGEVLPCQGAVRPPGTGGGGARDDGRRTRRGRVQRARR